MSRLRSLIASHRVLAGVLLVHAALFWSVVGSGSPWATGPVECAAGTMADIALGRIDWPLLDSFDGALGGMFVAGMVALPLFAVGAGAWAMKATAWLFAAGALLIVYLLVDRHGPGTPGTRRFAGLAAVAGLAFGPPAVFHTQLTFGNWHWTQLVFDYGVALVALELLAAEAAGRRPGAGPWVGFGLLTGLGIFNNFGSLPFLAIAWGGLALLLPRAIGVRAVGRLLGATAGALVGVAPFLAKLAHAPFGRAAASDQTAGRLARITADPSRVLDLMGEELAWALHVHDVLPQLGAHAATMAGAWVAICWLGTAVAAVIAVRGRCMGAAVPVLFAAAFCGALLLIETNLDVFPLDFSNVRGVGARVVPPLLTALIVAAAMGWSALASSVRGPVRVGIGVVALVPAAIGLATLAAASSHPAQAVGGVGSYRSSCMDVTAFYASKHFGEAREDLQARCAALADPGVALACTAGAAWGAGYYRMEFATGDAVPAGWEPRRAAFSADARRACDPFTDRIRARCLLGLGWAVGQRDWGRDRWPLAACDSLPAGDRESCWRGIGFQLGDHLAYTPERIGQLVLRAPVRWRRAVAHGAGYSMGRTWADPAVPRALCEATGPIARRGCVEGIDEALTDR